MIRRATTDDVEEIANVYERSFATLAYLPVLHTLDEHRYWFARQLAEHEAWVLGRGRRPRLQRADRGRAAVPLPRRRVDRPWHRLCATRPAKERRPDGFTLWTFQQNEGARRFYERHGLTAIEFTEGERNEEQMPDVRYAWNPPA